MLLVEDHDLVRFGTRRALEGVEGWTVIGETGDGREAVEMAKDLRPNLVLLDLSIRRMHGIEVLSTIKRGSPEVKVLVVTGHDSARLAREALNAGADGYVLKDTPWEEFLSAMVQVVAGSRYIQGSVTVKLRLLDGAPEALSHRERQILDLTALGLTNKSTAGELKIHLRTVEFHMANIMAKLGASNRMEAVRIARERGWLA